MKAIYRSSLREIRQSLGRYLAILAIVGLGVGFFAGLRLCQPSMAETGIGYLEQYRLYDFRLLSTLGFTEEDAAYFASLEGVAGVSPVRQYAPASAGGEDAELWSDAGLALMGAGDLWREGVTGDGTVIAVMDSGFNTAHEAFADASLTRSPAVGREDIAA